MNNNIDSINMPDDSAITNQIEEELSETELDTVSGGVQPYPKGGGRKPKPTPPPQPYPKRR